MNQSKIVQLKISEPLWDRISAEAEKRGQTVSAEIRRLLYDHFFELEERPKG